MSMVDAKYSQVVAAPARERDARVDFFRGLALIFIFVDHIPENFFEQFTLHNFGFIDAADVFVGLAGYAAFLAYTKTFDGPGWGAGLAKVARRIRGIYLAHTAVLIACVAVLVIAADRLESPIYENVVDLNPFLEDTAAAFRKVLTLVHQPAYLDILPLYVVLLMWFPILLWLLRLHVALALAASAMLWLGANFLHWNLPSYPHDEGWFLNPFAWQLLFSLGVITAYLTTNGNFPPRRAWLMWLAAGVVSLALIVAAPWTIFPALDEARVVPTDLLASANSKQNLSLWRVVHFAALAYIASAWIPARASWLANPLARRVIDCGRHSLPVFSLGVVLSIAGAIAMAEFGPGWISQISINAFGIALLGLTGWALAEMKRGKASSPRANLQVG
jgi:hypothetical protein